MNVGTLIEYLMPLDNDIEVHICSCHPGGKTFSIVEIVKKKNIIILYDTSNPKLIKNGEKS